MCLAHMSRSVLRTDGWMSSTAITAIPFNSDGYLVEVFVIIMRSSSVPLCDRAMSIRSTDALLISRQNNDSEHTDKASPLNRIPGNQTAKASTL